MSLYFLTLLCDLVINKLDLFLLNDFIPGNEVIWVERRRKKRFNFKLRDDVFCSNSLDACLVLGLSDIRDRLNGLFFKVISYLKIYCLAQHVSVQRLLMDAC